LWTASGAILGYMLFDLGVMIGFRRVVVKSTGAAMYAQLWMHHVLSLLLWPVSLHYELGAFLVAWFLFSEVSNVPLTLRTILIKLQHANGTLFLGVSISWLVIFFVSRIIPIPLLAYVLATAASGSSPLLVKFLCYASCPIPMLLNLYWFSLMLDGARKSMAPKKAD